jgi:predicted nucleotidyltransferase
MKRHNFPFNPEDKRFRQILEKNKAVSIAVFGSFASGTAGRNSDIDFLVEFQKDADLFDMIGLKLDLEEMLKRKVDIVTRNSISKYIRKGILEQAIPI